MIAPQRRSPVAPLLAAFLVVIALPLPAVLGGDPAQPAPPNETLVQLYELDRRSHPAILQGWEAVRAGRWDDLRLAELPELATARLVAAEADRVSIALSRAAAERLRARGVRLNSVRVAAPAKPIPLRALRADQLNLSLYQSLAAAVNSDAMMAHLEAISAAIQTRYYNTAGMQAATQYVLDRFVEYGLDSAYFDAFTYNGHAVRNVVGVKTGTLYPSRIYLIGAHLDATSNAPQSLAPGAEDNGSGSVSVLEAARLLAPLTTDATIYFVCFTAEEQGLVGSEHLAAIADQQNWDLRGMLNLDMVGFDLAGTPDIWLEGFYGNPNSIALMDLLENVANSYTSLSVYRYPQNGWGSDHVSFNNHGFPAAMSIDANWDDYACYHQTCDVLDNLMPGHLREMAATTIVAAAQLAGLQSGLGWVDGIADRLDDGDDSGILVEILGTGYPTALSSAGGAFVFNDLLPGSYTLRASASGYETATAQVTISAGQGAPVYLPLTPLLPAVVRGGVYFEEGGAAAGARLYASGQQALALSNALGAYHLEPVIPGPVQINAVYPGRIPVGRDVTVPNGGQLSSFDFILDSSWDFETDGDDLIANAGWQWGSDAVSGAHSGTKVWGTVLGANYSDCADYRLDLPPLDLRLYQNATLRLWHWYRSEATYDGGNIQISTDGGASWSVLSPQGGYTNQLRGSCNLLNGQPGFGGNGGGWAEVSVDLSAYVGQPIRLRLWFASDGSVVDRGWYVDDVRLEGTLLPAPVPELVAGPGSGGAGLTRAFDRH